MTDAPDTRLGWLLNLLDEGKQCLEALLQENASLRSEVSRAAGPPTSTAERVAELGREVGRLVEEVKRLADVSRKVAGAADVAASVEEQYATISNLFVAAFQIHSAVRASEVVHALEEVLVNLVGAKGVELWLLDPTATTLKGAGLGNAVGARLEVASCAAVARGVATGEVQTSSTAPRAVVPLTLKGGMVGVVVVRELLPHKSSFVGQDLEMFNLLTGQFALALYRALQLERAGLTPTAAAAREALSGVKLA